MMRRRSAGVIELHRAISWMVRWQPSHCPVTLSMTQTLMQGDSKVAISGAAGHLDSVHVSEGLLNYNRGQLTGPEWPG
jgi:hypothetical protein